MFAGSRPALRSTGDRARILTAFSLGLFSLILIAGCGEDPAPTAPLPPPSEYLSTHDFGLFLPDTLIDTAGAHDIRIMRVYATAAEERMLRMAESLYPPSAQVAGDSGSLVDQWWLTSFDGIKVDKHATRGALDYYLRTIRAFQTGDFTGTLPMQASGLAFRSSIEWTDYIAADGIGYHGVYAAQIELEWYQICGNLCAMGFSRKRTVILDSQGELLKVVEPKYVGFWVS